MWRTGGPRALVRGRVPEIERPPHFARVEIFEYNVEYPPPFLLRHRPLVRRSTDQCTHGPGSDGSSPALESVDDSELEALLLRFSPAPIGADCILSLRRRVRICFGPAMRFGGTRPLDNRFNRSETREAVMLKKKCDPDRHEPSQTPSGTTFFSLP